MVKIINGRKYNTLTDRKLAEFDNRKYGDFDYLGEELYVKTTGEYFLYGEGGPMTKYCKSISQNTWVGGSMIIPLSVAGAKAWVEDHCDADTYIAIFGPVEE